MKQKLALLALLLPLIACGQRQDTIFQTLATNYIGTSNSVTFGPVTNIGQGSHQALLYITNQPAKTCALGSTATSTSTQIQFVPNPFGASTGIPSYNETIINSTGGFITARGNTVAPYIYINVRGFDFVNCQMTLTYFGSLYPGFPDVVTFNGAQQQGIPTLLQATLIGQATAGTYTLQLSRNGYVQQNIYGVLITNTTANQNVTLMCGSTVLQNFNDLAAGQVVNLPFTNSAYYLCPNGNIEATLANSTTTDVIVYYKFE